MFFVLISLRTILAQNVDSLVAKRGILSTQVYLQNKKLNAKELEEIFQTTWQPHIKYKWANILKPAGPILAIGGVGLAYVALKGRVPVKVIGSIKKGDNLIASNNGYAVAAVHHSTEVFAISLETNSDTGVKLVEALVL